MTLDRLETHDRLQELQKDSDFVSKGCYECINKRPKQYKNYPFYIWAHARTAENGYDKHLIWMPRLNKPPVDSNSMLFRCYPPETIKTLWLIPDERLFSQYSPVNMMHDPVIWDSIQKFMNNKKALMEPEPDDLPKEVIMKIMMEIRAEYIAKKEQERMASALIRSKDL